MHRSREAAETCCKRDAASVRAAYPSTYPTRAYSDRAPVVVPCKYTYLHVVQVRYGGLHGWEDVAQSEDRRLALDDLRAYRANAPEYPARMIRRRERTDV